MGVVIYMYLKHSPYYIESKYIWVHSLNYLGSCVFADVPFFGNFSLTQEKEEVCQGVTHPMLLPE